MLYQLTTDFTTLCNINRAEVLSVNEIQLCHKVQKEVLSKHYTMQVCGPNEI
jgi:hypothetical protein